MPGSLVDIYYRLGKDYILHLQGKEHRIVLKMGAEDSSETLVKYHITRRKLLKVLEISK
jgi:hypothetical protein